MPRLATLGFVGCSMAGLWIFPDAAGSLLRGVDLSVTTGRLIALISMLSVFAIASTVVKLAVHRPMIAWLTIALFLMAVVAPTVIWRSEAFATGALWLTVLAGILLLVGTIGLLATRDRELDDRLVDPVTGEKEQLPRAVAGFTRYAALAFPVTAALLAVVDWQAGGH